MCVKKCKKCKIRLTRGEEGGSGLTNAHLFMAARVNVFMAALRVTMQYR